MADSREVVIDRLGAQGDGIAETADGQTFVPFALPGEHWDIGVDGEAPCQLSASPDRQNPVCRHFGVCGGCKSQHMSAQLYAAWKQASVAHAFTHRGITADVRPMTRINLGSRRRAFLGVEREGGEVRIGFREEGQHALVDMMECPILDPQIVAALPQLKAMARIAMPPSQGGRLIVTKLDNGLDVSFDNGIKTLPSDAQSALAGLAETARLVRLTVAGNVIVTRSSPVITIAGVAVEVPPSLFLQAVPQAEALLIALVTEAVPEKAKRVADLFSGLGTFTFPIARKTAVTAWDSDKRAIGVLEYAARHAMGLKPIEARLRDLFREPLSPKELESYDCVVFDPPRAGAAGQAERLARAKVPVVIAVSCAPSTLARDARTLIDGGYKMGPVTPIDQFVFSRHIEAAVVFRR